MTTLYRPVLIESAAQAEALPIGTVTLPPARHSGRAVATVKCDDGLWRETGEEQSFTDSEMLDEIALVPIEAEEEWAAEFESGEMYVNLDEDSARAADGGAAMSRLVTPWEAV